MTLDTNEGTSGCPPEIFPLPNDSHWSYGQADKLTFGWTRDLTRKISQFELRKAKLAGRTMVKTWPLTPDGWQEAWAFMDTNYPALAANVKTICDQRAGRRAEIDRDTERRSRDAQHNGEYRATLDAQERIGVLYGCVFLGGYGLQDGIRPGDRVDLYCTSEEIWITKAGQHVPYLRRGYGTTRALEFDGGIVSKGGGYIGGGFGLAGAAAGIATASLLNSLTTKSSIHTTVRVEADDAELFFFTDRAAPKALRMQFAEVRARIKSSAQPAAVALPSAGNADVADRLLQLGEMFKQQLLTSDEFAAAKSQLLGAGHSPTAAP